MLDQTPYKFKSKGLYKHKVAGSVFSCIDVFHDGRGLLLRHDNLDRDALRIVTTENYTPI